MGEYIRSFEFGNPVAVPDNISKTVFFFDQMRNNHVFMITILFIMIFFITIIITNILRFRVSNSKFLIYFSGLFIFFTAVAIKLFRNSAKISDIDLSQNFLFDKSSLSSKLFQNINFDYFENSAKKFLFSLNNYTKFNENLNYKDFKNYNDNEYLNDQSFDNLKLLKGKCLKNSILLKSCVVDNFSRPVNKDSKNNPVDIINDENFENANNTSKKTESLFFVAFKDQYVKKFLNVLNNEFSENNNISSFFINLNNIVANIEIESKDLDLNLKIFFEMSANIEPELRSFNSSTKNYKELSIELIKHLKSISSFKNIIENLNFKNSTDLELNNIFKKESFNQNQAKNFIDKKQEKKSQIYLYFYIFLILELFFGIFFIISIISNFEFLIPFKFFIFIFLLLNLVSGIVFLINAQFLDKNCILGRVAGCESNFGPGLKSFVSSANINLKSNSKLDGVSKSFEKIQYRTEIITTTLKNIYNDNAINESQKILIIFKNLMDNISFVEDDFEELTRKKISKQKYFKIIKKIRTSILKLEIYVKSINREKLLDFYSREITFLNYIKNEKANIIMIMEDQINRNQAEADSENEKMCVEKKRKICQEKQETDKLSMFLILGPIIFLILFSL